MESSHDPSSDQRATFILHGIIDQPSSSNVSVAGTESDEKLDLSLSVSCYDSSSLASSSSSNKKRKASHNPESASSSSLSSYYNSEIIPTHRHIPKKPFKNMNAVLLDSQGNPTLSRPILSLSPPDPFAIKKTLEESDVIDLARLMLAKGAVEAHVLAHWDNDMKERFKDREGVVVKVWDLDVDLELHMKMKIWGRNGSVVINDKWISKFVKRRGLRKGDRIGLCWDKFDRRLEQLPIQLLFSTLIPSDLVNYNCLFC